MKIAVSNVLPTVFHELKEMLMQIDGVEEVHSYADAERFFQDIKLGENYDVVLVDLDCEYEKERTAFSIKVSEFCPEIQVLYLTEHIQDYIKDTMFFSYDLKGILLKKPLRLEMLRDNFQNLNREKGIRFNEKLSIRQKGTIVILPFSDIVYLENQLHKTKIVLKNREYVCNESLTELKNRLNHSFLTIHKSYVVNMEYIEEFRNAGVLVLEEKILPISKSKYKEAKSIFLNWINRSRLERI